MNPKLLLLIFITLSSTPVLAELNEAETFDYIKSKLPLLAYNNTEMTSTFELNIVNENYCNFNLLEAKVSNDSAITYNNSYKFNLTDIAEITTYVGDDLNAITLDCLSGADCVVVRQNSTSVKERKSFVEFLGIPTIGAQNKLLNALKHLQKLCIENDPF
ncbi:hypothetical protein [Pseudoalteromonas arctica]|uniref:Orphan protein n=1 Tax=Pseudoalteromonas arctica TaxID=394751 RepID=A0A7Y0DQ27_9GAMM|nr:hypothetical protein [Pseudoalteromonas arctica]NMM39491.1 hypothetical protein [Pseudoalteromonas arctica]